MNSRSAILLPIHTQLPNPMLTIYTLLSDCLLTAGLSTRPTVTARATTRSRTWNRLR